jgi:hypothetical protein
MEVIGWGGRMEVWEYGNMEGSMEISKYVSE